MYWHSRPRTGCCKRCRQRRHAVQAGARGVVGQHHSRRRDPHVGGECRRGHHELGPVPQGLGEILDACRCHVPSPGPAADCNAVQAVEHVTPHVYCRQAQTDTSRKGPQQKRRRRTQSLEPQARTDVDRDCQRRWAGSETGRAPACSSTPSQIRLAISAIGRTRGPQPRSN